MKFAVMENNSGGLTVWLDCAIEDSGRAQVVVVEAEDYEDMVDKVESHVDGLNWGWQNSYEGNSCNCCGRRWRVYKDGDYMFEYYSTGESGRRLVVLKDAPKSLKEE